MPDRRTFLAAVPTMALGILDGWLFGSDDEDTSDTGVDSTEVQSLREKVDELERTVQTLQDRLSSVETNPALDAWTTTDQDGVEVLVLDGPGGVDFRSADINSDGVAGFTALQTRAFVTSIDTDVVAASDLDALQATFEYDGGPQMTYRDANGDLQAGAMTEESNTDDGGDGSLL